MKINKYTDNAFRQVAGFTLIEVLIAMTILSLILVLLFSTIFTANRTWAATERKISHNDELRFIAQFIQKNLSQNTPLLWVDRNERKLLFIGEKDELYFTSGLPSHRGGGGIQAITLTINKLEDKQQLSLFYEYIDPENKPFEDLEKANRVVLLDNIDRIELSYYGKENSEDSAAWHERWENDDLLPELISLIVYPERSEQAWPEMIIPIHVDYVRGQPQFMLNAQQNS